MKNQRARGRRPGAQHTREQILAAARERFLADGYQAATMRSIAAAAGVDVALIAYYFGSKADLFAAAMALTVNPVAVASGALEGDLDTVAVRVLTAMLATWDAEESGGSLRRLASAAAADPELARPLAEVVSREIVGRVAARLEGDGAMERAAAFTTQIVGVVFARYVIGLEPVASMPAAELVRRLAPSMQLALAPGPPSPRP